MWAPSCQRRQNNPTTSKTSVGEAAEVLDRLSSTHKYLLQNGVGIQKRLESHPASRKMGISQRPTSASLGDTPEMPSYSEVTRSRAPEEIG